MKMSSILKTALKTFLWIVLIFAFMFFLIAGLIQIPSIQTRIVHYATSFIGNKTHTKVEIRTVSISFPKSIVLEGLYLEDQNADTLIYAGKAEVNIALTDLFSSKINIADIDLEEATVNMKRTRTDSLFNYNFLTTAFSDTATQAKAPSKWTFKLENAGLTKVRFHYDDQFGGMNVTANIENAKLGFDLIDLEKSDYQINDLVVEKLIIHVLMTEPANTTKSTSTLPKLSAKSLELNHSIISYIDSVGKQSVATTVGQLKIKDISIDLQKQLIGIQQVDLSKSGVEYTNFPTLPIVVSNAKTENGWKVQIRNIEFDNNSIAYNTGNQPEKKGLFDAQHVKYNQVMLVANDFEYSSDLTAASIRKFSGVDQNNFSIAALETDFRMDQHSISAKKIKAKISNSIVDADFSIQYTSLTSLMDSMKFSKLNLDMKNVSINNSDLLYFNPDLAKQSFFKDGKNNTFASGKVIGSMNNLSGKNLVIKTGTNTNVETDFKISGLPAYQTANYHFPNLKIISGRKDLEMIAGSSIPPSIEIPENIDLQIVFNGWMKAFETTVGMTSSIGAAQLSATIGQDETFRGNLKMDSLDLGKLLKDSAMYGPVSLTAEAAGHGLNKKTVVAKIKTEVSAIYLNKYTYHKLNLDGNVTGQEFDGKINMKDENLAFDFDGLVNLNPNKEHYQFRLNIAGADLQKLKITKNDVRIGLTATADFKGGFVNELNGKAGLSNIIIAQKDKKYRLEQVLLTSVNTQEKSELTISSALFDVKYSGTVFPYFLAHELNKFVNSYFNFSDVAPIAPNAEKSNFTFELQLHNHPIISEVILPQLKEFEPGLIQGSFDSRKNQLKLDANIKRMVYGTTEIKDFAIEVDSDVKELKYSISCKNIANAQINLDNFLIDGKLAGQKMNMNISSIDEKKNKKLLIRSEIKKDRENFKLTFDPTDFYLMDKRWNIAPDNYIAFGKQGFLIHHLFLNNAENQINIASVHDRFNDDLNIVLRNFKLDDLSGILEKDSSLVKGVVDGNVLLKRVNNAYGLIADAQITNLFVRNVPIGNLTLKAENASSEKFNIDLKLSGADNNLTAIGYFIPKGTDNSFSIKTAIQSLSMKTIQAFSMGTILKASGSMTGNLSMEGNASAPELTGELVFNNALITPAVLNNQLELKHETIQLKTDGIYFDTFTVLDSKQHTATINGAVKMNRFKDFNFALNVNTKDFLLFNTTAKDNKNFFGRMIIDSKIDVSGPMALPVVNAMLKMKKGSNFTVAVPEEKLTTDKGEEVVEFDNGLKINPILTRNDKKGAQKTSLTGFDVTSIIEIDKQATLRLLMDPASTDSLVVRGEAALSFTIDRSGKMSLTGAYNLNDGSYLVSLESVIKRKFDIDLGSTIVWSGDPYNANITIDARYTVRASPIDLVADQMSGLSEADKNGYKQRYRFFVLLKLRGELLHPQISFEIQLPPEDKGILGGAVNQKLAMLNENESALNKQVFALLVLGRFIQENPLQTESGNGTSTLVRATVGKYISQQLNQWSNKVLPGVDLNFDVQSYNEYQTGQAKGRTQVDIGLKKQLFNDRLSVELGGSVDVEGEKASQNSASDITSDVTIEYKLTKDGRYRMKGFRHNQYEGVIEGQLVETGVGVMYIRDFNKWKYFFKTNPRKPTKSPERGL